MVDNQLVEIGILFPAFDEEPIPEALASDIRIRLGYVCERCSLSATRRNAEEANIPMC